VFTKPFKSGEYAEGVKVLQNLLTTLQLYTWTINGIYGKATKDAVYRFQLSKWLLKGYEKKPDVRWWMGPATRAALNQLTK
jgi:peptidoglycan hydrolase-like protein with peptidoglycan-binding domain